MGDIVASMELENASDSAIVRRGLRDESTIRRTTVEGVVDTGVVMLVLPEDVVRRLGLKTQRQVTVVYADERGAFSGGARGPAPRKKRNSARLRGR